MLWRTDLEEPVLALFFDPAPPVPRRCCTVCIYGAGVEFDRKDGVHANTYPLIRDELLRMAQGITWREL